MVDERVIEPPPQPTIEICTCSSVPVKSVLINLPVSNRRALADANAKACSIARRIVKSYQQLIHGATNCRPMSSGEPTPDRNLVMFAAPPYVATIHGQAPDKCPISRGRARFGHAKLRSSAALRSLRLTRRSDLPSWRMRRQRAFVPRSMTPTSSFEFGFRFAMSHAQIQLKILYRANVNWVSMIASIW
jgi:hypothetical protein